MERTSNKLIIWIRCVNKERHAKYAERGGARTGIENLCSKSIAALLRNCVCVMHEFYCACSRFPQCTAVRSTQTVDLWPPPVTCVWICCFYGPRRPGLSRTAPAGHWGTGGGDSVNDSSVHFLSLPRQTNLSGTQTNESKPQHMHVNGHKHTADKN